MDTENDMDEAKKYAGVSIPQRESQLTQTTLPPVQANPVGAVSFEYGEFAEVEYEVGVTDAKARRPSASAIPAAQPIAQREIDPIRELFFHMRNLASGNPFARNDAGLFYKQAKFMERFSDDYWGQARFSMYYPYYQHMGYEQLRTRSKERRVGKECRSRWSPYH